MNLLFIHGAEKLKEDKSGNYYTDGSYNRDVWNRYLSLCDGLNVIFRKDTKLYEPEEAREKFQVFDKSKIKFIEIPDLNESILSFINLRKRYKTHQIIKNEILRNNGIIVRLPSSTGNIEIKYAKKFKKLYCIEVVSCSWDTLWYHSLKGKLLAFPSYVNMKRVIKSAPFVLYVSNRFLQDRYPTKGYSIGCSDVVIPSLHDEILERRLNKIKSMDSEKPVIIGTTGAINVLYKGQEYVVKAISRLNEWGYNFEYHVAGGGDNGYLKSFAKKHHVFDKVKFLGSLPHDKVFEYLDNIDIYIQPSKTEGLPRALIEGMSRACPSFGSNTGGIPELLNKECTFHVGSVDQICDLLKNLDKERMIKLARMNFMKAKEYDRKFLDDKRDTFYRMFANKV